MVLPKRREVNRMGDLIYRQNAIDAICSVCGNDCDKNEFVYNAPQDEQVIMCPEHYVLSTLPSAEPEIIHCKNCKHRESNDCPMYYEEWIEIDEGDGYFDTDNIIHDWTTDEGFCHCAELRGEEE